MANSFKYLSDRDRVVVSNNLYTLVEHSKGANWHNKEITSAVKYGSGSLGWGSTTPVFDVTYGRASDTNSTSTDHKNQVNVYNEFSKILLGVDENGGIKKFNLQQSNDTQKDLYNAFFLNLSRNHIGDKIAQGTFTLTCSVSDTKEVFLTDKNWSGDTVVDTCQVGNYSILYATASDSTGVNFTDGNKAQGLLFYEAGVAVVSPYIFAQSGSNSNPSSSNDYIYSNSLGILTGDTGSTFSGSYNIQQILTGSLIKDAANGFTNNLFTASYSAITELNSTVYFCRAYNHEFNYSTNPTFVNNGEIVVKNGDPDNLPRTYITTVGLYSDDNQLLAVAKLSEPILKTPENELIARIRLDF